MPRKKKTVRKSVRVKRTPTELETWRTAFTEWQNIQDKKLADEECCDDCCDDDPIAAGQRIFKLDVTDELEFHEVQLKGEVPLHVEFAYRVLRDVPRDNGVFASDQPAPIDEALAAAARVVTLYLERGPLVIATKKSKRVA